MLTYQSHKTLNKNAVFEFSKFGIFTSKIQIKIRFNQKVLF